jgi:hypothetical protein
MKQGPAEVPALIEEDGARQQCGRGTAAAYAAPGEFRPLAGETGIDGDSGWK